jgi:glutamate-1-semialdehyde 2,1-aminomutase
MNQHELYEQVKHIIPGGSNLLSKRPERNLLGAFPPYYSRAKGCELTDLEGKKWLDMYTMSVGACILGYADPDVDAEVKSAIDAGNITTVNSFEEVELARLLVNLHPWADMARFARTGGEAMAVAIRIARAYSKKDKILFCGYHGWHDWYVSSEIDGISSLGVPCPLQGTSMPFKYNDTESFVNLIDHHKDEIGVVVMESIRNDEPKKEFLDMIQLLTRSIGAVLVVDEITAGFRVCMGGAHLKYDMKPDIAVFSKAMSNGYPMAAIIGRKEVMSCAEKCFISSTYWTDRIGPVAALATIRKLSDHNIIDKLLLTGRSIKDLWMDKSLQYAVPIQITGIDAIPILNFTAEDPMKVKSLYTQLMLEQGILAGHAVYLSYAHINQEILMRYQVAVDNAFKKIAAGEKLIYPVAESGFRRLI